MSKTYRRKNAWNKHTRCLRYLKHLDYKRGESDDGYAYVFRKQDKYKDLDKHKIIEKTNSMFHTDNWFDDELIEGSYKRKLCRQRRTVETANLRKALKKVELETPEPVSMKHATHLWWYGLVYYF